MRTPARSLQKQKLILILSAGVFLGMGHGVWLPQMGLFALIPLFLFWKLENRFLPLILGTFLIQSLRGVLAGQWLPAGLQSFADFTPAVSWLALWALSLFHSFSLPLTAALFFFFRIAFKRSLATHLIMKNSHGAELALPLIGALILTFCEFQIPALIPAPIFHGLMMSHLPWIQLLSYGGPALLTFLFAWLSAQTAFSLKDPQFFSRKEIALASTGVFLCLQSAGLFLRISWNKSEVQEIRPPEKEIHLTLVQPTIDLRIKENAFSPEASKFIVGKLISLSERSLSGEKRGKGKKDVSEEKYRKEKNSLASQTSNSLVIWPETAIPDSLDEAYVGGRIGTQLREFSRNTNSTLLTGAYSRPERNLNRYNAAVLLQNENIPQISRKAHLFPFGESLPGEKFFPLLKSWFPRVTHLARASEGQLLEWNTENRRTRIAVALCFEILFSKHWENLSNGNPDFFVHLSNESWFQSALLTSQSLALAQAWAITYRKPLIRVDNSSGSAVIGADGTIRIQAPHNQETTMSLNLALK